MNIASFRRLILDYYRDNKRILPWRETINPYWVFLSEVMLQQTQVPRVMVKFAEFTAKFPDFNTLSNAGLPEVLSTWQGLGYNRRGKYLRESAQIIVTKYSGTLPKSVELVDELPGIGQATASAIVTYTYNIPTVFIETNVRRVFIHHFFEDGDEISDSELRPIVEEALDKENPRDWYYALMDYGTYLSKQVANPNRRSKHYSVQSKFEGSIRQVRGALLRFFLEKREAQYHVLQEHFPDERLPAALSGLVKDGILMEKGSEYKLHET